MNMNRASELDAYWIAERYHGSHNMNEFVNCLHQYKVPRDDGILIWHIIDAAVDIAPQNAKEQNGHIAQQPQERHLSTDKQP